MTLGSCPRTRLRERCWRRFAGRTGWSLQPDRKTLPVDDGAGVLVTVSTFLPAVAKPALPLTATRATGLACATPAPSSKPAGAPANTAATDRLRRLRRWWQAEPLNSPHSNHSLCIASVTTTAACPHTRFRGMTQTPKLRTTSPRTMPTKSQPLNLRRDFPTGNLTDSPRRYHDPPSRLVPIWSGWRVRLGQHGRKVLQAILHRAVGAPCGSGEDTFCAGMKNPD